MDYPVQIDMAWLAAHETGALAAMITAGSGPISASVLASTEDLSAIEEALLGLPRIAVATMHGQMPDPSSFIALSERGLFAYDWSDVHRTLAEAQGAHELISSPSVLLRLIDLPPALRRFAGRLRGMRLGRRG